MFTKESLIHDIADMGINPKGTLLIHSSLKSVGPIEGRADVLLDAWCGYMWDGLLIFPTHTWRQIGKETFTFDSRSMPSCVGILPEIFRRRPGAIRSLHPTHSVAALGKDAKDYTAGEEIRTTPCPREGCWGKLLDRDAEILFLRLYAAFQHLSARRRGVGRHSRQTGRENPAYYYHRITRRAVSDRHAPPSLSGLR